MSLATNVSNLATRIGTEIKSVKTSIGSLSSLTTSSKTSVVSAINELDSNKLNSSAYTASDVLSKLLTVDGTGSGLDADTLDGQSAAAFATAGHDHSGVYQPLDADLTAIAALSGTTGILKKTAADTWSLDTNTYATASDISSAISNLVNGAPSALDTLNELATALGNDGSFSTTITTALGNRVRVDAAQTFDTTQQAQGRSNIGAASSADVGDTTTNFVTVFEAALV